MYKQGTISSELRQYLLPSTCHPGRLKRNPKIHKAGNPMRSIICGIGTATEKLAEVAEGGRICSKESKLHTGYH